MARHRLRIATGVGDYASDLRNGGRELLQTLLEPRTADRGQINRKAVSRMIEETLLGAARWTKPLGVLLTLELFQRQFVDGDGAPGSTPTLATELLDALREPFRSRLGAERTETA
jgi:hypothetical protein